MGIEPQRRVSYYASAPAFDSHSLFIIALHYVRAFEIRKRASLGPSSLTYIPSLIVIPAFYPHRITARTAVCVLCARASVTVYDLINQTTLTMKTMKTECQILLDETSHVHGWVTSAVEPVVLRVRWWVGGCGCVGSSRVTPRAVPRER